MKPLLDDIASRIDLRPESLLRFMLVMLIVLSAGPEVFAAWELRLLLELLGATLFITAYFSGLRLLAAGATAAVRDALVPAALAAMLLEGSAWDMSRGALLILIRAAGWLGGGIVLVQWGQEMLRMLA